MIKCQKTKSIRKIFPFALYRIDDFAVYLTRMRQKGLMFERMSKFGVLYFKQVNPRNDLNYIILTTRDSLPWFRYKYWDIDFMKKHVHQFEKNSHKLFTIYSLNEFEYHIYVTPNIHSRDIIELKKQRKKRLVGVNIIRTLFYIFMFFILMFLLWGCVEAIQEIKSNQIAFL